MIKKLDINSEEFINELEITKSFTDKVCAQMGFVYNPESDVNESVQQGLTRNKLIYNKRFCPCFMVIGDTKEEQKAANNRVCPCTPALEVEIPNDGKCRCGIFCTPQYAQENALKNSIEEATHTHSRGLSKKECDVLLSQKNIDSSELEALLIAREEKTVDFNLVDVREWMEWVGTRIQGCDYLIPTTSFYNSITQIDTQKDKPVIVYCHIGSRSAYCQRIMKDLGFKMVVNLEHGIVAYQGELTSGE
ncbi:MAG: ferredoxin-thioredoxin reductase catalytic domain-containing protein [Candidatus Marinarcus sp.]|uniref:ferredoxin-thioredoxin reductase catalytic domain-containing protein n=1 Tax=Candidatus Marinarcus sp. TaxID=3100987 RepID=UPI003B001990